MKDFQSLKTALHEQVFSDITSKIVDLDAHIADVQDSKNNDTKSSAGDKHETARAMAQIELENNQTQRLKMINQRNDLDQIDLEKKHDHIAFGSLVKSSMGLFYMSIGLGKVKFNDLDIFVISMASPIGQVLIGKKIGEKAQFQSKEIDILDIA